MPKRQAPRRNEAQLNRAVSPLKNMEDRIAFLQVKSGF